MCFGTIQGSFEQAASKLAERCQLKTSNDTVRAICDEEGQRADQWVRKDSASVQALAKAKGQYEFSSDGTSVNTSGGWREMRLSGLGKRESAGPATVQQWDPRVLPKPTARLAWCQMADCQKVEARWERMFGHAGIDEQAELSVMADGAKWIWDQAGQRVADGRAIGSGLIEGGCKNTIRARLKLNSARWRIRRAEHMGALRCLQYSDVWDDYWQNRTA